jgi:Domain of unknown function (DUF6915)
MAKPIIHAFSSSKKFGGKPEDYIEIHNFMDSSKSVISDNRHRALTHNSWFLNSVLERVFGLTIKNSDGEEISVKAIGEEHVLEDYGHNFIPSAQDFLQEIEYKGWMNGHGVPGSRLKVEFKRNKTFVPFNSD